MDIEIYKNTSSHIKIYQIVIIIADILFYH